MDLDVLFETARASLKEFYASNNKTTFESRELKTESHVKASSVDISELSQQELLQLLYHRDSRMKLAAVQKFKEFIANCTHEDTVKALKTSYLRPLLHCLCEENEVLQIETLTILVQITDEKTREEIRKIGGLPILSTLWNSKNDDILIQIICYTLSLAVSEQNQIGFVQTHRIQNLVKHIEHDNNYIRVITVEALINITLHPKAAQGVLKTGILEKLIPITSSSVHDDSMEAFQLIQNLCYSENIKDFLSSNVTASIISQWSIEDLKNNSESEPVIQKQKLLLDIVTQLIQVEKFQQVFIEKGYVSTLLQFLEYYFAKNIDEENLSNTLLCLFHTLEDSSGIDQFVSRNGHVLLVQVLIASNLFSENISLITTKMLAMCCVYPKKILDNTYVLVILQSLLEHIKSKSSTSSYYTIVSSTIETLSENEGCKLILATPVVSEYLFKNLLESNILEVLNSTIITLQRIALLDNVKAEFINAHDTVIPILLYFIQTGYPTLQLDSLKILSGVYTAHPMSIDKIFECGGVKILMSLREKGIELLIISLATLGKLLRNTSDKTKATAHMNSQGVVTYLLGCIVHEEEMVQNIAIAISIHLMNEPYIKEVFLREDITTVLESLTSHKNVLKEGSVVKNSVNALSAQFDTTQDKIKQVTSEEDPDVVVDKLLSQLTKNQLKSLVKEALAKGCDIIGMLTDMVKANMTNPPVKGSKEKQNTSPGTRIQHKTPVMSQTNNHRPSLNEGPISMMDELQHRFKNLKLKKTEPSPSKPKMQQVTTPMESIGYEIKQRNTAKSVVLLDSSTESGRKYWIKDKERYTEELDKAFSLDYQMMRIIFEILQSRGRSLSFKEYYELVGDKSKTNESSLSTTLLNLGFSIKQDTLLDGKDTFVKPTQIMSPFDIPIEAILQKIISTIEALKIRAL